MFLGTELIPVAAEDTYDPRKNIPKGLIRGMVFSITTSFLLLIVGSSMPPGLDYLYLLEYPMPAALKAVYKNPSNLFALLGLPGLISALQATALAYGRVLYSLARAGLLPPVFATQTKAGAPLYCLLLGAVLGYVITLLQVSDDWGDNAGFFHVLLFDMTMITGFIHLGFIVVSFIVLRVKCKDVSVYMSSTLTALLSHLCSLGTTNAY